MQEAVGNQAKWRTVSNIETETAKYSKIAKINERICAFFLGELRVLCGFSPPVAADRRTVLEFAKQFFFGDIRCDTFQ